jgi:hypothetical protein
MRKTGLVFEERDLERFRARGGFDLLLLPPGFSLTTNHSETTTGIDCLSLSEFIENGEISKLSTQVAPAVRDLMSRLRSESVEAKSSQNDLYQYHLRLQWLYVVALDRFFDRHKDVDLWVAIQPYENYDSPMRPEVGVMYSNARLLAYLASTLASYKCMTVRTLDGRNLWLVYVADTARRIARKLFFKLFLSAKLVQKTLHARKRSQLLNPAPDASLHETVGIIVRTDSEVISASFLIQKLQGEGIPYCVIHDEIISSTTALERLESMGIPSVSIGSMLGLTGVWRTWFTKAGRLDLHAPLPSPAPWSHAEQVLLRNEGVLNHLKNRLHDFYSIQLNFRLELDQIIDRYQIGLLVTYAYVDQWGGVIKTAGDRIGIKTLAIQNAAQDPEEYPRLCWADYYCVESQYLKHKLISLGYPGEKLAATGLPQFSSVDSQVVVHKNEEKSRNQLLILTQPIYQAYFDALIEACAGFAKDHGVDLAIKYHPRQRGNEYDKVIQKNEPSIRINVYRKEPLDDIILKSSAVISIVSAALIRSINLGTPTISFLPVEERHLDLYYANNANLYCVSTIAELTVLLKQIKSDETGFRSDFESRRNHYLKEHASFEPTGNPEDNIMMCLLNVLKGREAS